MAFGRLRESSKPSAEINMIPLIDVMLVLLVIFILTAPLVTQSVKLQLPEATDLEEQVIPEEKKPIILALNGERELFLNEKKIESGTLLSELKGIKEGLAEGENPLVQLHIDATVPYEEVAKLMTDLSKVGLSNLGFVTLPETAE